MTVRMLSPIIARVQIESRLLIVVARLSLVYLYPLPRLDNDRPPTSSDLKKKSLEFKSMKSYRTKFQATSICTRSLIGLNITFGLRPRATSNRHQKIYRDTTQVEKWIDFVSTKSLHTKSYHHTRSKEYSLSNVRFLELLKIIWLENTRTNKQLRSYYTIWIKTPPTFRWV